MRMNIWAKLLVALIVAGLTACSSDEQKQAQEPIQSEQNEESDQGNIDQEDDNFGQEEENLEDEAEGQNNENADENLNQGFSDGNENPQNDIEGAINNDNESFEENQNSEFTDGEVATSALETQSGSPESRKIYYIISDGVKAYDRPNEGAQVIGSYFQGDAVVVREQGEWGALSNNRYIKISELSSTIVPRVQEGNEWRAAPVVEQAPVEVESANPNSEIVPGS